LEVEVARERVSRLIFKTEQVLELIIILV